MSHAHLQSFSRSFARTLSLDDLIHVCIIIITFNSNLMNEITVSIFRVSINTQQLINRLFYSLFYPLSPMIAIAAEIVRTPITIPVPVVTTAAPATVSAAMRIRPAATLVVVLVVVATTHANLCPAAVHHVMMIFRRY